MIVKDLLFLLGFYLLNIVAVMAKSFTPSDLTQLPSPGIPVTSPSGKLAVYAQSAYNITEAKTISNLYLLNIQDNSVEELTKPSFDTSDSGPFFLDDQHVAYFHHESKSKEEVDQLYVLDLKNREEGPYRLTNFPIAFGNIKYNVDRKLLAFSASVYNEDGTLEGTLKKDKEIESTKKDTALVFDQLMVRHWDAYVTEKKNNIFVVDLAIIDRRYKVSSEPINLLRKTGLESPGLSQGDASDFDISADASQIAFVSKSTKKDSAWQSSAHVYIVSTSGKEEPIAINKYIPAASSSPHFTSSGLLVYFQMLTPQYEADRNRIVVYNPKTQEQKTIAESWDSSPHEVASSADSKFLYVTAEQQGRNKIFRIDLETESVEALTGEKYAAGLKVLPSGNIFYGVSSMNHPVSPHVLDVSTKEIYPLAIESGLAKKLESIDLADPEEIKFTGALEQEVHGWYLKPANYRKGERYPVVVMIHGGPRSAESDSWSSLGNFHIFADAGYGVISINFHGSTGYGQAFTDSILNDWGSYPFYDIETGLDYVLNKYPYLDSERVVGLGGSYGGYMINWLNGHSKKFKAFVNHAGIFSMTQFYYTTDLLYFAEKFGGSPVYPENRANFEKWSPSNFVQNWKTPTLITHGGQDYRVSISESLSTFTALQRQGIPSRFVYFPDENHGIWKPANSLRWHKEVLEWIGKYTSKSDSISDNSALLYQL